MIRVRIESESNPIVLVQGKELSNKEILVEEKVTAIMVWGQGNQNYILAFEFC